MSGWIDKTTDWLKKLFQKDKDENSEADPQVAHRAKHYIDEVMDEVHGPEGGAGEQWPPNRI